MHTHPNKVENDDSALCCAVPDVRPEAWRVRDAEKDEPDAQGQLGIEFARLVEDELAGDSTEQGRQSGRQEEGEGVELAYKIVELHDSKQYIYLVRKCVGDTHGVDNVLSLDILAPVHVI